MWLTDGWPTKDHDIGFLQPTNKSSEKIKAILETNHKRRTFERTKHLVGESSGRKNRDRSSTPQRVEDLEETMSAIPTGSAASSERRRRIMTEAEKEERYRRKRGVSSQDTTLVQTVIGQRNFRHRRLNRSSIWKCQFLHLKLHRLSNKRLIMPLQVKSW
ncbi:uncharacterized protein LOC110730601 isoform X2 [Chenopodium quinoa]|uniref:uncharacterized protein LOC110730601 isoform X2 n=1 Tax=Chenopodium quinoa TaxID=63459 RepID=UPI000B78CFB3|nr:uncharacterized protein LOC110730601 isoform X2 [Chenopodium quinoa]